MEFLPLCGNVSSRCWFAVSRPGASPARIPLRWTCLTTSPCRAGLVFPHTSERPQGSSEGFAQISGASGAVGKSTRLGASSLEGSLSDTAINASKEDPLVGQVMNKQVICLKEDMPIRHAMQLFLGNGISGAPVVDKDGMLVGVLSETDIIATDSDFSGADGVPCKPIPVKYLPMYVEAKAADSNRHRMKLLLGMPVREFMTRDPIYVEPGHRMIDAAKLMMEKQVNRLPVCRNGHVVGIFTRGDMLQCLLWEMLMTGSSIEVD